MCFFLNFLVSEIGTTKYMKANFQKLQTLEKIIKNIPRAVTMYHDHPKEIKKTININH